MSGGSPSGTKSCEFTEASPPPLGPLLSRYTTRTATCSRQDSANTTVALYKVDHAFAVMIRRYHDPHSHLHASRQKYHPVQQPVFTTDSIGTKILSVQGTAMMKEQYHHSTTCARYQERAQNSTVCDTSLISQWRRSHLLHPQLDLADR